MLLFAATVFTSAFLLFLVQPISYFGPRSGGVIVYNVTNRFVNLPPLLKLVAEAEGMKVLRMDDDPTDDKYSGTSYVLVSDNPKFLADRRFVDASEIEPIKGLQTWTDGFNNLFKVVR